MGYDREFDDFLTTTVTYQAHASLSLSGAQTLSTASKTVPARIEMETREVRDAYGHEVVSMARVFMRPTASDGTTYIPTIKDQITLPAGYNPLTPPIIQVLRHNDVLSEGAGVHHWEIVI